MSKGLAVEARNDTGEPETAQAESKLAQVPVTIIEPSRGWVSLRLKELVEYRDLLFFLAWRDVSVRYKQTILGAAWAVIQPFFSMVVLSIFFGRLARIPSDGVPYPIFSYAAMRQYEIRRYPRIRLEQRRTLHDHAILGQTD